MSSGITRRGHLATFALAVAVALIAPAGASAATTIGQSPPSGTAIDCGEGTGAQFAVTSGNGYGVPASGVITRWRSSFDGAAALSVLRPLGGGQYRLIALDSETNSGVATEFTARIPVLTGDLIGMTTTLSSTPKCAFTTANAGDTAGVTSPKTVGAQFSLMQIPNFRFNVAADVEPDADGDGFGDETQDLCPTDPARQDDCSGPPPPPGQRVEPGDLIVTSTYALDPLNPLVFAVDPVTGERTVISSNDSPAGGPTLFNPQGLAVEADGSILVGHPVGAPPSPTTGIIRINPVTGARTTVTSNSAPAAGPTLVGPLYMEVEDDGDILVSDQDAFAGFTGGIIRVDPTTGARSTVSANGAPDGGPTFVQPNGIGVESDGSIVVSDPSTREIVRVDPVTGARTLVSANNAPPAPTPEDPVFTANVGLAIECDGDLLVANNSNVMNQPSGVLRVAPTDGTRTRLSVNGQPAGDPQFNRPLGIASRPSDGRIFVVDPEAGAVLSVDPVSGARQIVSSNSTGSGPAFGFLGVDIEVYDRAECPATPTPTPPQQQTPDTELSGASVTAKKKQAQGGKKIKVTIEGGAQEAVIGVAEGRVARGLELKRVEKSTAAAEQATYRLKLEKKAANEEAFNLLDKGKKVRAKLALTLTDAAGNSVTENRAVRLKRK